MINDELNDIWEILAKTPAKQIVEIMILIIENRGLKENPQSCGHG